MLAEVYHGDYFEGSCALVMLTIQKCKYLVHKLLDCTSYKVYYYSEEIESHYYNS